MLCLLSLNVSAQSFADELSVFPVNAGLEGHNWSHRQGLEFDVVNHKAASGNGIHMYIGVSGNITVEFADSIPVKMLGQTVTFYTKCDGDVCQYTSLVNTGLKSNKYEVWTQIWLTTEKKNLDMYLEWLAALSFSAKPS
jgi:hypothetical protein